MSSLEEHIREQEAITAEYEQGVCDHAPCILDALRKEVAAVVEALEAVIEDEYAENDDLRDAVIEAISALKG